MDIKEIRDVLTKIKIPNEHIKRKGGSFGDYIAWTYAVGEFLKHYPEARWEFTQWEQADGTLLDVQYYKDGSCSVEVTCWIGDIRQHMWLPVTKNTSNEPSANCFDINTAKMRCLTKCIAVCFGLGAEVYNVDMLQDFKTEKVEGSKRISNSPSNGVTNPSLPQDSEPSPVIAGPFDDLKKPLNNVSSSVIAEPDAPSFNTETKIKCGYNKGETYSSYADIKQVRKDLSYWNSNAKNDDQKQHLSNLKMVESMFIEKGMQSFKAGV